MGRLLPVPRLTYLSGLRRGLMAPTKREASLQAKVPCTVKDAAEPGAPAITGLQFLSGQLEEHAVNGLAEDSSAVC